MLFKLIGLGPKGYISDKMNLLDGSIVIITVFEIGYNFIKLYNLLLELSLSEPCAFSKL